MKSYLFYDIETTGLNKSFDQVLQFAAIRTDTDLNETDRYNINVKLRPDVIPSPYASITHRISIAESRQGMSELSAIRHIHALFNTPGTVSLGYNTLGFDDEFLRFSFYRNLLPVYTHQYANSCYRADILPLAVLYYLYKPETLNWPEVNGKTSLKLEHIATQNGFATGRAHDALVDVEATLEMARRFSRDGDMWKYTLGFFDKKTDKERQQKLPSGFESSAALHSSGLMTGIKFGADNLYQAPVLYLGDSVPYPNQSLWLRLDQPELSELTMQTIDENAWVIRKRSGESPIILPPLERFLKRITPERQEIVNENLKRLQVDKDMFYKLITHYREFEYPVVPDVDVDAALYLNGFMTRDEQKLSKRFHHVSSDETDAVIDAFGDSPLRELARRIRLRNGLGEEKNFCQEEFDTLLQLVNPETDNDAMIDFRGKKKTTPFMALADIESLRADRGPELDDEQVALLNEIEVYVKETFNRVHRVIS